MTLNSIIRLNPMPRGFGEIPDELEPRMFESELPVQHSHEYFEDNDNGLFIGVWDTGDMVETAGPYAMDEFMLVLEGQAIIRNNLTGEKRVVEADQAFVLPRGFDCQWQQHGYLKKHFMIFEPPGKQLPDRPALADIALLPDDETLNRARPGCAALFSENEALGSSIEVYANSDRTFRVGTWQVDDYDSGAGKLKHHLMGCVRDGAIHLTDAVGQEHHFVTGDVFFIPAGTVCTAKVADSARLFYCLLNLDTRDRHDNT